MPAGLPATSGDPAALSSAASAADVGGTVALRVSSAAAGRYVLVWFTSGREHGRLTAAFAIAPPDQIQYSE